MNSRFFADWIEFRGQFVGSQPQDEPALKSTFPAGCVSFETSSHVNVQLPEVAGGHVLQMN